MADVVQLLLQHDLFVVLGATLFAAHPAITRYWLPVIHPNSAPEQFQFPSGAPIATTVTRTATLFPKPTTLTDKVYHTILRTQTATRTATVTATVPKTIYDTITEQVTSISTYYDRHWVTKWTHLSVDPVTPCTTTLYSPDGTMPSSSTPAWEMRPPNVAQLPTITPEITSWVPWRLLLTLWLFANLFMWFYYLRSVDPTGETQKSQVALEIMKRSRQDVTNKYAADRADLIKRCEKAERVAVMVEARNVMLQQLGVSMPSDEADNEEVDEETILDMMQARMNVLGDEKQRLSRLERDNKAQAAEITRLKNVITTQLNTVYVPGVSRPFDELLQDKQREINIVRNEIHESNIDENIKENYVLHQKKDAELSELRPLRDEVVILREALVEAKKETARVEEEKKAKGVADERRWNDARVNLRKERSDEISALKERHANRVGALESRLRESTEVTNTQKDKIADLNAQLYRSKRSLASSNKTQQPQPSDRTFFKAPMQCFNDLRYEQNTVTENEDYLRQSLHSKEQECRQLQQNFTALVKQHLKKDEELERLKDQNENDKKHCENEKDLLRRKIADLEKESEETAQMQGSRSSAPTDPTTNELQSGCTALDSSAEVNETLQAQVASLSKDIEAKEAKENDLTARLSTTREQLEAKLAQEQALATKVTIITQQRNTAVEEIMEVKKQLEEAKSDRVTVWSELHELKAATNNNEMTATKLKQYQAESVQRERDMEELKKSNSDLLAQNNQLRTQGIHEINSRDQQILKLQSDATTGNQTIHGLEQQLFALKAASDQQATINAALSTTHANALKNELKAEKDRYLVDVNSLKNDVDHWQREFEKEQDGRKNDVKVARQREAKAIDEVRHERQQEIDDLKNSQESSMIKKLHERVEFYEMENTDLKKNGREGWKNLLQRKNVELRAKDAELGRANGQIRHWQRLYNIFHRRFEGLERNHAYKAGEVDYAEARAGLFMGSDVNISDAMEKCVKFTEGLEAEVERLNKEVDRLRKYDGNVVDEEMAMVEEME